MCLHSLLTKFSNESNFNDFFPKLEQLLQLSLKVVFEF